ncbi:unnamed protein product [Clonostachys byssicola]|uniref:Uncharacterized protein n=1 Tax=Clonostachys byssicola TaxID=160290 RepID=A0A9N9Y6K7_9HYPO|nr:unnamed protein product [Clonostachys byssicola]
MDAETISQVTQSFHQIFSHIPHAVYGLSALALHGDEPSTLALPGDEPRRLPRTVHVLCPEHTRQTILHWAAIKQLTRLSPVTREGRDHWGEDDNGYSVYSTEFHGGGNIEGHDLVLAVAIPDGSLRRVRIVFEDQDEFSRLPKVPAPAPKQPTVPCPRTATSPQVLSLPAIVTRIVLGYQKSLTDGASTNTQKVMRDGLVWVLDQIINSPPNDKVKLDGTWKTNLSSWVFLVPFTEQFPEAEPLLEQAGIENQF